MSDGFSQMMREQEERVTRKSNEKCVICLKMNCIPYNHLHDCASLSKKEKIRWAKHCLNSPGISEMIKSLSQICLNELEHEDQETISSWANKAFGETSVMGCAIRANEEMAELLSAIRDWDGDLSNREIVIEGADVIIVLMRLFELFGVDYRDLVNKKMRKNRRRKWKKTGTGHGYHV